MLTQTLDQQYLAHTYNRFPLEIVGGKGSLLRGADGREYIDLGSGIGVNGAMPLRRSSAASSMSPTSTTPNRPRSSHRCSANEPA